MEDYTVLSDEKLQELSVSGDRRAEEALLTRFSQLVRMCARPYYLAGGESEDLTQEGMLGLLSAIREYRPGQGAAFKSFAELCIQRRIYSAIRSAQRGKHAPLNSGLSLEEAFPDNVTSDSRVVYDLRRSPEEQVLARESADEFFQTFSRCLSTLEKQILEQYLAGHSYRSIAAVCGRDEKAVDNAVQRIRRKLARNLLSGDISHG